MSQQYFYQHEDTGRVCCIASSVPPSHRWYPITEEQFRQHESQLTPVAADALCDCYISVPAGNYPDLCAHCGKKARR